MSAEVLTYLYKKDILTDYEYGFYTDTLRKRVMSDKQLAIRERINQKFLDFTSPETNSYLSQLNRVLKWAESNGWFDTGFINSLKGDCEKRGTLTEKQSAALNKIIVKLKIV